MIHVTLNESPIIVFIQYQIKHLSHDIRREHAIPSLNVQKRRGAFDGPCLTIERATNKEICIHFKPFKSVARLMACSFTIKSVDYSD